MAGRGGACGRSDDAFRRAAALVNELVEAKRQYNSAACWPNENTSCDRHRRGGLCADGRPGSECIFQVIAERAEKTTVIVATNLPFSDGPRWSPTLSYARRCWMASLIGPHHRNRRRQLPLPAIRGER